MEHFEPAGAGGRSERASGGPGSLPRVIVEKRLPAACEGLAGVDPARILEEAGVRLASGRCEPVVSRGLAGAAQRLIAQAPDYDAAARRLLLWALYDQCIPGWEASGALAVAYQTMAATHLQSMGLNPMQARALGAEVQLFGDERLSTSLLCELQERRRSPMMPQVLWLSAAVQLARETAPGEPVELALAYYYAFSEQRLVPPPQTLEHLLGSSEGNNSATSGLTLEQVRALANDDLASLALATRPHRGALLRRVVDTSGQPRLYRFPDVASLRRRIPDLAAIPAINVARHQGRRGHLDTAALRTTVELAVRMQEHGPEGERAFAVAGYPESLTCQGISPGSIAEIEWADRLYEILSFHAWTTSAKAESPRSRPTQLVLDALRTIETGRPLPFTLSFRETLPWGLMPVNGCGPVLPVHGAGARQCLLAGVHAEDVGRPALASSVAPERQIEAASRRQKWTHYAEHIRVAERCSSSRAAELLILAWRKGLGSIELTTVG